MKKQNKKTISMEITWDECKIIMKSRKKQKKYYLRRMKRRQFRKDIHKYFKNNISLIKQRGVSVLLILVGMSIWSFAIQWHDGEMAFTGLVSILLGLGVLLAKKEL